MRPAIRRRELANRVPTRQTRRNGRLDNTCLSECRYRMNGSKKPQGTSKRSSDIQNRDPRSSAISPSMSSTQSDPQVASSSSAASSSDPAQSKPTVVLVIGMAGSGKTTFMKRMATHCKTNKIGSYFINLDPAVLSVPYKCHIDIRDSVKYKNVMEQYKLGPNGGILTSLNLFATKFHQVLTLLEKRAPQLQSVLQANH